MNWYIVDHQYIDYLLQFDNKVGYVDYGNRIKIHVGTVLFVNDHHYYVPVSSAKPKHQKMSNQLDFHKVTDKENGYVYAVLNLNNMIPVPAACLTQLKYDQIHDFRVFHSEKQKTDYIYLLQKEKRLIDDLEDSLKRKAEKLYDKCSRFPESALAARCCNFRLLEEKANLYKSMIKESGEEDAGKTNNLR